MDQKTLIEYADEFQQDHPMVAQLLAEKRFGFGDFDELHEKAQLFWNGYVYGRVRK